MLYIYVLILCLLGKSRIPYIKITLDDYKEAVSLFLNRDRHSLAFADFCMLEEDEMTVAVEVDGVLHTFTCSMHGDIVEVVRTDGGCREIGSPFFCWAEKIQI